MDAFFVNLPLGYVASDPSWLHSFILHGLHPELGMDGELLDEREESWHRETAAKIREGGLRCSVHLPFFDLQPGSVEPLVLEATRKRLKQALQAARHYNPSHLVGHLGYDPVLYAKDAAVQWKERSIATWKEALSAWPDHPPLYLENVRETDPRFLSGWFSSFSGYRVGFCFDVGHWFSFGEGAVKRNLAEWMQRLGPVLAHLHLHDNRGGHDDHLGIGQGKIPFDELLRLLPRTPKPGITLEPHSPSDLEQTLAYLRKNPEWGDYVGQAGS